MKNISELRKDERGQAIVEFALILPILLFLVLGVLDLGAMLNAQITITSIARSYARDISVLGDNPTTIKFEEAQDKAMTMGETMGIDVALTPVALGDVVSSGEQFTVTVSADVDLLVSYDKITEIIPDPFPLDSEIKMRME